MISRNGSPSAVRTAKAMMRIASMTSSAWRGAPGNEAQRCGKRSHRVQLRTPLGEESTVISLELRRPDQNGANWGFLHNKTANHAHSRSFRFVPTSRTEANSSGMRVAVELISNWQP